MRILPRRSIRTCLAAGMLCFVAPELNLAHAGDIASFSPVGFSSDGTRFAFEEHGVQDGSGFPYSSIFAIDTVRDTWLEGTPVHVRIENETTPPGQARRDAYEKARPVIEKFGLGDSPGLLAAFSPASEVPGDPHLISYYTHAAVPSFGAFYTLGLEEIEQPVPENCKGMIERSYTFRIRLLKQEEQRTDRVLYEDSNLPGSRRCVTGYRLGGVMIHHTPQATVHIALITVLSAGFEGNDGRWIAVPVKP